MKRSIEQLFDVVDSKGGLAHTTPVLRADETPLVLVVVEYVKKLLGLRPELLEEPRDEAQGLADDIGVSDSVSGVTKLLQWDVVVIVLAVVGLGPDLEFRVLRDTPSAATVHGT